MKFNLESFNISDDSGQIDFNIPDGYYFFHIRSAEFLDYALELTKFKKNIQEFIIAEISNNSPYSHIMDILYKKFGDFYLLFIETQIAKKSVTQTNVMEIAKNAFKTCYVQNYITMELVKDPEKLMRTYRCDSYFFPELYTVKLNDDRVLCLMPWYMEEKEINEWLFKNLEYESFKKISPEHFILYDEEDLNYLKLIAEDGYEPYSFKFKDIAQDMFKFGFQKEDLS